MNRRDLLLQEMGIQQWQLRRPELLKGAVKITVADHIRLIIISESNLNLQENLIQDILLSAEIQPEDCLCIDVKQTDHLILNQPTHYWLLEQNSAEIDRSLPDFPQALSLWKTSNLNTLKQNANEKRALWQQIQAIFKSE